MDDSKRLISYAIALTQQHFVRCTNDEAQTITLSLTLLKFIRAGRQNLGERNEKSFSWNESVSGAAGILASSVAIADDLTPQIAPKYRVSIEERVYTSVDDVLLVGIADVAVADRSTTNTVATVNVAKITEPRQVKVPMPEEVIERFLEVRSTQSREVVTVIEVLSPLIRCE